MSESRVLPSVEPGPPWLSLQELHSLNRLARLPAAWTQTVRSRRLLFLGMAAPGFFAVFAAPLHRNLSLLFLGFVLFAAALDFRRRSERVLLRAEAAALWPPALWFPATSALSAPLPPKETPYA